MRRNFAFITWYRGQMAGSGRLVLIENKPSNVHVFNQYEYDYAFVLTKHPFCSISFCSNNWPSKAV